MKILRVFRCTAALLMMSAALTWAWEPLCRDPSFVGMFNDPDVAIEAAVCTSEAIDGCTPGLQIARGRQLGEHAGITRAAMRLAGLEGLMETPAVPRYFTDRTRIEAPAPVGLLASVEPTGPQAVLFSLERPMTAAEFSELGDSSYSVADLLLGHEHCPAENAPQGSVENVQACHTFESHMGSVNSTHFSPQNRAVYEHYHAIALDIAERCRRMNEAIAADHPLRDRMDEAVAACEQEALVFGAFGAHFLEDAWSSGHMWERWGSPVYADTPRARMEAQVVSMVSGLVHGWRAVARRAEVGGVRIDVGDAQHDQLCMAGPFDATDANEPIVEWAYAPGDAGTIESGDTARAGGGDLYLLPCLARNQDSRFAVFTGTAFRQ